MNIVPGLYKHFKGNRYKVIGLAKHSEGEPDMVVYRPLYGSRDLWVRPLDMFTEMVEVDGFSKPRFEFLEAVDE